MAAGKPSPNKRPPFGQRLFEARTAKELSQEEMAQLLGISQNTYSFWERQPVALREDQINKLVEILGVTPNYLFGKQD